MALNIEVVRDGLISGKFSAKFTSARCERGGVGGNVHQIGGGHYLSIIELCFSIDDCRK